MPTQRRTAGSFLQQRRRRSPCPIWRREEFGWRERERANIHGTQMWFSYFLLDCLPLGRPNGVASFLRSSYRVAVAVASGGPNCPVFFLPVSLPSFLPSFTTSSLILWFGDKNYLGEREGPFPPPCAAIKLNCRSDGGGIFLLGRLA